MTHAIHWGHVHSVGTRVKFVKFKVPNLSSSSSYPAYLLRVPYRIYAGRPAKVHFEHAHLHRFSWSCPPRSHLCTSALSTPLFFAGCTAFPFRFSFPFALLKLFTSRCALNCSKRWGDFLFYLFFSFLNWLNVQGKLDTRWIMKLRANSARARVSVTLLQKSVNEL